MAANYAFTVEGMKCGKCADKISSLSTENEGIVAIDASFESGLVKMTSSTSAIALKKAIESLGFKVAGFVRESN